LTVVGGVTVSVAAPEVTEELVAEEAITDREPVLDGTYLNTATPLELVVLEPTRVPFTMKFISWPAIGALK